MSSRVILIGPLPPPFGGVSVHLSRLLQLLSQSGYPSDVLYLSGKSSPLNPRGRCRGRAHLLLRLMAKRRGDELIHDHTELYQSSNVLLSGIYLCWILLHPDRVLLTIHDGSFENRFRASSFIRQALTRLLVRQMRSVIVISNALADFLSEIGVEKEKIVLIRSFLPLPPGTAVLPENVESFLRRHPVTILAGGAFEPVYHFDIVLEAFISLRTRDSRVGLVLLAGSFSEDKDFRKQCDSHLRTLGEHAMLLNDIPHEQTITLLGRSALVIRSAFPDGDGLIMREALLLGRPVVASETGERPGDVITYSHRDPRALERQVTSVLETPPSNLSSLGEEAERNLQALMKLYKEAGRKKS